MYLRLDPLLFTNMNSLANLTYLEISNFELDLRPFAHNVEPSLLWSVRSLYLHNFVSAVNPFGGQLFVRVFSFIFPGLVKLSVKHTDDSVREAIDKHKKSFLRLKNFVFELLPPPAIPVDYLPLE